MSQRAPPPLLLAATMDILRKHAPFGAMREADLAFLAGRLKLRYFAEGATLLAPEAGPVNALHIIQRGAVRAEEPARVSFNPTATTLAEGECFPVGALVGARATSLSYVAAADTFCYLLANDHFQELLARSRAFHDFCTRRLAHLLEQSQRSVRDAFAGRATEELTMASPLRRAVRRAPETMPQDSTLRSVLERMKGLRIGSIVLIGADGQPSGIFTQTDVLDRVALAGIPLDRPIAEVMTRDPAWLTAGAALSDAAQLMARNGFRHVLVMDEGKLAGVISERDLFTLQRLSMQGLRKDIRQAQDVAALAFAAHEVRGLATAMLAQGVAAENLTQFVSTLNDALTARAIELTLARHDVASVGWCWIGLGSEGRMEQTLATDQDNAIIFPDAPQPGRQDTRARLLAFAHEVNMALDACGFPLCKGDIMARNPRWCLTLGEWIERFGDWMANADPEALLNASIFFDFRPIFGEASLAVRLRAFLLENATKKPAFLRQMAANALQVRPPLGVLGDFALGDDGAIDLKKFASRPFVDAARILALGAGVGAVSTAQRLRQARERARMAVDEVATAIDAFHFIQMLRLRRQEQRERDSRADELNRVDPVTLNSLDRRILKEALRQARKLQNRIALDYQL